MQGIYQFHTLKEHLTDVESHIDKDILENKSKINQNLFAWMSSPVSHGQQKKFALLLFFHGPITNILVFLHLSTATKPTGNYPWALCEILIHKLGHTYFQTLTFFLPQISEAVNREGKKGSLQTASDQWCRK